MKRFWDKVDKSGECWSWTAACRRTGYGAFKYLGKVYDAHRFSWMLSHKKMPDLWILHKCDNKKCVNPDHLFEGTRQDNIADALVKGLLNRKYFTPEEKLEAQRAIWRKRWHKQGKFRREERKHSDLIQR